MTGRVSAFARWRLAPLVRRICAFSSDTRGNIAAVGAAGLIAVAGSAVLAIDVAALYVERRHAQGAVDLAAMAAAGDLANAKAAAVATLSANGLGAGGKPIVTPGRYAFDPQRSHAQRFVAGQTPHNAVQVQYEKPGTTYFASALFGKQHTIAVSAIAATDALAAFSVGSRLLALRDGVANSLLGALFGTNVSLTAMDYEALLGVHAQVVPFLDALATRLDIEAGSYNDILATKIALPDMVAALRTVALGANDAAGAAALGKIGTQLESVDQALALQSVLDVGPLGNLPRGGGEGWSARFNALELISATALLSDGARQVSVDLNADIPGLLGLSLDLAIGEPARRSAWARIGGRGATVRTAQMRVALTATVAGSGLLDGVALRLPLFVDAAFAQAQLDDVVCDANAAAQVAIAARTGVVSARIGDIRSGFADFSNDPAIRKAVIVKAPLMEVGGSAYVEAGGDQPETLVFTQADIDAGRVKRTVSANLAQTLVSSLIGNLDLDVRVVGLQIGLGPGLSRAVRDILGELAGPLDAVAASALATLGLRLGEADVRVHGARCGGALLTG